MQVSSVGSKQAHDLGIAITGNTNPDFMGTNVHSSGVGLDAVKACEGLSINYQDRLGEWGT
jgi:hypothetical protein